MGSRAKADQIHVDWTQIGEYVNGTLNEWERHMAETHFNNCNWCRENLVIKIKTLPFQAITLDGEPRTPGLTPATLRCGWSRQISHYVADRMSKDLREILEAHLVTCEMCRSHLGIYLQSLDRSHNPSVFFFSLPTGETATLEMGISLALSLEGRKGGGRLRKPSPFLKALLSLLEFISAPSQKRERGGQEPSLSAHLQITNTSGRTRGSRPVNAGGG